MKHLILLFITLCVGASLTAQQEIYSTEDIYYVDSLTVKSELGIDTVFTCIESRNDYLRQKLLLNPFKSKKDKHVFIFTTSWNGEVFIQNQTTHINSEGVLIVHLSDPFLIEPTNSYLILEGNQYQIYSDGEMEYVYDSNHRMFYRWGHMVPSIWLDDIPNIQLRVLDGEIIMFFLRNQRLTVTYTGVFIK